MHIRFHYIFLFRKSNLLNNFLLIGIPEDHSKTQYSLEFIINDQQNKKTKKDYHITDIEEYKKKLYIYPVSEGINPLKEPSGRKESSQTD